jgi:hypothetical protein
VRTLFAADPDVAQSILDAWPETEAVLATRARPVKARRRRTKPWPPYVAKTLDDYREAYEPLGAGLDDLPYSVRTIISDVCKRRDVPAWAILAPIRIKTAIEARWEAQWRIRQIRRVAVQTYGEGPLYSLPDIGQMFGQDHSTVINGVRQYEAMLERERLSA